MTSRLLKHYPNGKRLKNLDTGKNKAALTTPMSWIRCKNQNCTNEFNGAKVFTCPHCLSEQWTNEPKFIAEKHDPASLPKAEPRFRSVVTPSLVEDLSKFTKYAAESGEWFFSKTHQKYCHFTKTPLNEIPGSGILKGDPMPNHALDSLLIADADKNPHAYAVDSESFRADVMAERFIPLPKCSEPECENLAVLNELKCQIHT
jgi:hypothetical protein